MNKKKRLHGALEHFATLDEETLLKHGIGCTYENWPKYYAYYQQQLMDSEEIMLGVLEQEWQLLSEYRGEDLRKWPEADDQSPLEILALFLDRLNYPPPELLQVIVSLFHTYLIHEGDLSLEEVFFGNPKNGVGNFAARWSKPEVLRYRRFHRMRHHSRNQTKTLYQCAEEYMSPEYQNGISGLRIDYRDKGVDDFLRQYRRWLEGYEKQVAGRVNKADK